MKKKEHLILIIFAVILLSIVIAIAYFVLAPVDQIDDTPTIPNPTQSQIRSGQERLPNETKTNPPIQYEAGSAQKMIDRLNNRIPLSQSDQAARSKALSLLPEGELSGVLYRSQTVIIDYTNAADQFQVEILIVDIAQAKNDATIWLRSQGFSQQGICNLPVVFYLSRNVLNQLRDKNYIFNPLAEGC
jgi:cell division septation protein DedD